MAYVAAVTSAMRKPAHIGVDPNIRMFAGRVDITSYHATKVAITDITKHFRSLIAVIIGTFESGFVGEWDYATSSIKVWDLTDNAEATNDADMGAADFIAIGF